MHAQNNDFFTETLGLRRVKKTVNFDAPDVYHLYYGDETRHARLGHDLFPVPEYRQGPAGHRRGRHDRLLRAGGLARLLAGAPRRSRASPGSTPRRASARSGCASPVPTATASRWSRPKDDRAPWAEGGVAADQAIRGFHSASLRLRDGGATEELLRFMGYETVDTSGNVKRLAMPGRQRRRHHRHRDAARQRRSRDLGAGSVHHIAFAVENRATQLEVRKALMDTGYQVTPVIDRDYFWAIYFRTPGGVLFEVATNEPGFDRDEDTAHLGEALKLPTPARASARLSGEASAAARGLKEADDVDDCYVHKVAARRAGRPAALHLPRHRRRREPVPRPRRATCCPRRRSSRRAATSPNTARRASSAAPARASTTWPTWRGRPRRWRASCAAHVEAAKPSAGARARLFERRQHPRLGAVRRSRTCSTRAVLMHPLIPFEPAAKGSLAGQARADHRRPARSDLPARPDQRGSMPDLRSAGADVSR